MTVISARRPSARPRAVRQFGRTLLHLLCASVALGWASLAPAQFSNARPGYEKVQYYQGRLSAEKARSDSLDVAKNLYDACGTLMDSLSYSGRELSEFGNTFGDERAKPRRAAAAVRGQAEVMRAALDTWMRRLNSPDNHKSEYENVVSQTNELVKQWNEYLRRIDETRRWVNDGLNEATKRKEQISRDCKPIEDAQNAAWARVTAAQRTDNRADEEHDKALERCVGAEVKENDCFYRYLEATANRSMRSEDVWALRQQWDRAVIEMRDALSYAYGAYQTMVSAREELNRAYQQLAPTLRDMQTFTAGTDANKVVENFNYFVRWSELFTKEFN